MVKGINQSLDASFSSRIKSESMDAGYNTMRNLVDKKEIWFDVSLLKFEWTFLSHAIS
jgi:hypothetical protein